MKITISTSQRANTVRHEFIRISLYKYIQYIPVLVVNGNPKAQQIAQSIPILNIYFFFF